MAVKINIKGPIISSSDQWIYDWLGIEATSPKVVNEQLEKAKANGEDVEVEINSGGGSVCAGSEIYTALMSYAGKVTTKIVGLAAKCRKCNCNGWGCCINVSYRTDDDS